jgi:hypothetical protein
MMNEMVRDGGEGALMTRNPSAISFSGANALASASFRQTSLGSFGFEGAAPPGSALTMRSSAGGPEFDSGSPFMAGISEAALPQGYADLPSAHEAARLLPRSLSEFYQWFLERRKIGEDPYGHMVRLRPSTAVRYVDRNDQNTMLHEAPKRLLVFALALPLFVHWCAMVVSFWEVDRHDGAVLFAGGCPMRWVAFVVSTVVVLPSVFEPYSWLAVSYLERRSRGLGQSIFPPTDF